MLRSDSWKPVRKKAMSKSLISLKPTAFVCAMGLITPCSSEEQRLDWKLPQLLREPLLSCAGSRSHSLCHFVQGMGGTLCTF